MRPAPPLDIRTFRVLLAALAVLTPAVVFREVARRPLTTVPCGLPHADCRLGDPAIATSVLGRLWDRMDRGEPLTRDDRVFAPYPDTWALSEGYLLQGLLGYPAARVSGSAALGYNVPFFLGAAGTVVGSGLLFARLAGPGWPALLGAVLFSWGPGRLNNFGVLATIWAGLVPGALALGLSYLDRGRARTLTAFSASWLVIGFSSLYGLVLGGLSASLILLWSGLRGGRKRIRRLAVLAATGTLVAAILAFAMAPYFRMREDFDARASLAEIEGHAADLASLLHQGCFSGPGRTLLDALLPGFPEGASAFFPTFTFLAVAAAFLVARMRALAMARQRNPSRPRPALRLAERAPGPWLFLMLFAFVSALGPTVRFLGRPLGPGPWRLVAELPVLSSLRGIHRWDEWFDLGVVAVAVLLGSRLLHSLPPRRAVLALGAAAGLVLFDVWPRPVTAAPLPEPSPFDAIYRSLPRDSIVAVYPFSRMTSERSWVEQLFHGRRVVNGFQSFPPPIHFWLDRRAAFSPPGEIFSIYRELGTAAIEADLESLDAETRRQVLAMAAGELPGTPARRVLRGRGRLLFLFDPVPPVLVEPAELGRLDFVAGRAFARGSPGRLAFRLRSSRRPVLLETHSGSAAATMTVDLVGVDGLRVTVTPPPPPGSRVIDARSGRIIGETRR